MPALGVLQRGQTAFHLRCVLDDGFGEGLNQENNILRQFLQLLHLKVNFFWISLSDLNPYCLHHHTITIDCYIVLLRMKNIIRGHPKMTSARGAETFSFILCQYFFIQKKSEKLLNEGHSEMIESPPPFSERKRKIYSSNWDSIILRCSLWGFNPSSSRLNQDQKKGKNSTFERNLNGALTPWSTSLWVKIAISCMLSLNFENRGE